MKYIGKIIGAILGFMVGGPYGLLMGLILGHLYDTGFFKQWFTLGPQYRQHAENAFFSTTFLVMGHLAKIDGQVTNNEIAFARHVMAQLQLTPEAKQRAIELFNQGKQPGFNLEQTLLKFKQSCFDPAVLRVFIEIQLQVAMADNVITANEKLVLLTICETLGFSPKEFILFNQNDPDYDTKRARTHARTNPALTAAYQTLNISLNVTDTELKQSYRRLMSQHHPDKLIAKGLPPSMLKIATEKTQEIKAAYELICRTRGIK